MVIDTSILTITEMKRIIRHLNTAIAKREREKKEREGRGEILTQLLSSILGKDILRGRKADVLDARAVVAYQLREEGFSKYYIARTLNLDHTTIPVTLRRIDDAIAYPSLSPNTINLWHEVQRKLTQQ